MKDITSNLTLSVDIGGSGIKALILDSAGKAVTERFRLETPQPALPQTVIDVITKLSAIAGEFHQVSVGFPGVVKQGITETAVNLHPDWVGFDLATSLSKLLYRPVKVINDADMQGFGAISGEGLEMLITLGTGVGSALFIDGKLIPNLEMGHHPFRKGKTYEEQLGRLALDKIGEKRWNKRLNKAINSLQNLFNYDFLYIGGGEATKIKIDLPQNVKIVPNVAGLLGGIALWRS
jgi:polyphosphate glucokinase